MAYRLVSMWRLVSKLVYLTQGSVGPTFCRHCLDNDQSLWQIHAGCLGRYCLLAGGARIFCLVSVNIFQFVLPVIAALEISPLYSLSDHPPPPTTHPTQSPGVSNPLSYPLSLGTAFLR